MKALSGKLFQKIKRLTGSAIGDFDLIKDGDHIAVAVSGGKVAADSITMALFSIDNSSHWGSKKS